MSINCQLLQTILGNSIPDRMQAFTIFLNLFDSLVIGQCVAHLNFYYYYFLFYKLVSILF